MKIFPAIGLTLKFWPLDEIIMFLASPFLRTAEMKHKAFVESKVKKRLEFEAPRPDLYASPLEKSSGRANI